MTMWMKYWIVFLTACQHILCIEQPYRLVDANTTCLEIKVESRLSCNNRGEFYHCLLDENYTKEYEVCRNWKWIPGGKCAYFNLYGRGNVDERNCAGNSTKKCATKLYRSDLNMQYDACYVKKKIAVTTPIVPVTVRPTGSGTSDVQKTVETAPTESQNNGRPTSIGDSDIQKTAETVPTESAPPGSQFNSSALEIAFGVIVLLILLLVVVAGILFKKRRHTGDKRQRETALERGEGDALMDTETKCLAENEKNQIEKENSMKNERISVSQNYDSPQKNESFKMPPTSPAVLTKPDENSMKNERISVSQNYDSPQKNESFKMPPTSPAVQTEPDTDKGRTENKDDKKNEKKEGGGSREGHNSSEEVSPGAGEDKKTEEESIEGDPSVVEVLPDDGVKDDLYSSGDNGKQKTGVTEEDQSERTGNEDLHADGSSGEQNSEEEDVSVDTTQNSDSQSDERSGTSDNVSVTYVNEEEQEHPSKTIDANLNSSAGSGGGQDENASNEIKDAVGILIESLESITKEDDDREQHYYSVA